MKKGDWLWPSSTLGLCFQALKLGELKDDCRVCVVPGSPRNPPPPRVGHHHTSSVPQVGHHQPTSQPQVGHHWLPAVTWGMTWGHHTAITWGMTQGDTDNATLYQQFGDVTNVVN